PGAPCRLAERAARSPPAPPPITSTSVSVNAPANAVMRRSPRTRPVLHRRMHVDDLLGAEDLAAEAGDAVLAEADDGKKLGRVEAGQRGHARRRLHVDHVSRADDITDAAAGAFRNVDVLDHSPFSSWPGIAVRRTASLRSPMSRPSTPRLRQ